eukprot:TRINITY_DN11706_c2_g1_i1.p1 TRINITY_DN11706_c2_g1~~TRINITY_DN11706_c2_g1_i1.p1  ORF type:complete len:137 (-),score=7.52 TRINITY_DN11706_c2_g1_i1:25-435(-)
MSKKPLNIKKMLENKFFTSTHIDTSSSNPSSNYVGVGYMNYISPLTIPIYPKLKSPDRLQFFIHILPYPSYFYLPPLGGPSIFNLPLLREPSNCVEKLFLNGAIIVFDMSKTITSEFFLIYHLLMLPLNTFEGVHF